MQKTMQRVAIVLAALPSLAKAELFLHPWENHHESLKNLSILADVNSFSSQTNYDTYGILMSPVGLSQYRRVETELSSQYGITPELSAYIRGTWSSIHLDSSVRPGTAYGLSDQTFGLNYRLYQANSAADWIEQLSLQVQVDIPAYNNANADLAQTPWLGDQSLDLSLGGSIAARIIQIAHSQILLTASGALTARSNSLSSSLPWSTVLEYRPKQGGISLSLMGYGMLSLQNDPRGNDLTSINGSAISTGTGGSYISGSVNPLFIAVRGSLGYETSDHLRFGAGMTQILTGRNAPAGNAFEFTLQKRFGENALSSEVPEVPPRPEYTKSNRGLVDYAFEARVQRISGSLNTVKINKGTLDGIELTQVFDVFNLKSDGTIGEPVARGKITQIKPSEATLSIVEYFKEVWIEEGFIAKHPLQ